MPVVSPVAASACGPMEIETLPRSPGLEKRRLVSGKLSGFFFYKYHWFKMLPTYLFIHFFVTQNVPASVGRMGYANAN